MVGECCGCQALAAAAAAAHAPAVRPLRAVHGALFQPSSGLRYPYCHATVGLLSCHMCSLALEQRARSIVTLQRHCGLGLPRITLPDNTCNSSCTCAAAEERYPNLAEARRHVLEVRQGIGGAIFVPSGWHHTVENLEGPCSVSYWSARQCVSCRKPAAPEARLPSSCRLMPWWLLLPCRHHG